MADLVLFELAFLVVWTLIGMLVMKYFVRQAPILDLAGILLWAIVRVQIVVMAVVYLSGFLGLSGTAMSGLFNVAALFATGWLVTRHLSKSYGVPTKFPAVGAKVMVTMALITLLIVVTIIAITGA